MGSGTTAHCEPVYLRFGNALALVSVVASKFPSRFCVGLTGGLAAPLIAAGAGVVIGGAGATVLGSVAGVAIIGSLFGVAGAGLSGLPNNPNLSLI